MKNKIPIDIKIKNVLRSSYFVYFFCRAKGLGKSYLDSAEFAAQATKIYIIYKTSKDMVKKGLNP